MTKYILIIVLFVIAMSTIGSKNLRRPIAMAATNYRVVVTCNDNTVWVMYFGGLGNDSTWRRLPDIPQE